MQRPHVGTAAEVLVSGFDNAGTTIRGTLVLLCRDTEQKEPTIYVSVLEHYYG